MSKNKIIIYDVGATIVIVISIVEESLKNSVLYTRPVMCTTLNRAVNSICTVLRAVHDETRTARLRGAWVALICSHTFHNHAAQRGLRTARSNSHVRLYNWVLTANNRRVQFSNFSTTLTLCWSPSKAIARPPIARSSRKTARDVTFRTGGESFD